VRGIDELIARLCPEGVLFRALGEVLDYEQPGKYLVQTTNYNRSLATPVLTAGQTFILGYTDETTGVYEASPTNPVVIFDDFTTSFKWVDFRFKAKSSAMKILAPKVDAPIDLRFLYYVMQTITYRPQDHARQWISTYSKFKVPVPPIEIQHEIVGILDTFTELDAKLEAELAARKNQFAYYRDSLLTFAESEKVRWIPMGKLGKFIRGRRFTKDDIVDVGIPCIHYGEIYTHYGAGATTVLSHIRFDLANQLRYAEPGDVVIAAVGETVEEVAKAVAWMGDEPVAIHDDTFLFRSDLNPKYVAFVMQTAAFHAQKGMYVARAKVKRLSGDGLAKIVIPAPSIEEQQRVVAILDKFDALLNDMSIGIPAELVARRKQYTFYRDKLLAFKEAAA
jgi:type I restriction enzyme S subunit